MKKIDMLLSYLRKENYEEFISAKKLADRLGVTDRTIRSYIQKINAEEPGLIESSRAGYRMSAASVVKSYRRQPHNLNDRRFYLLRRLFKSGSRGVDIFDLADALYVSDATIRADIFSLVLTAKKYNLKISQKKNRYFLIGREKHKRDFMVDLIKEQSVQGTSFKEDIQKFLGDFNLRKVMKIAREAFVKFDFAPNTYFFQNFILHLALAIDRSKIRDLEDNEKEIIPENYQHTAAEKMIDLIYKELKKTFEIQLFSQDRLELMALCYAEMKQEVADDTYIQQEIVQSLDQVLDELSTVYLLDFSDDQFRNKLMYHLQNLYNRAQFNRSSRNFSLLEIKIKYPVIFDIAVYMASLLSEKLNIEINEDEISFLALHIGTFINHKTEEDKKLQTVIVMPAYLQMRQLVTAKLLNNFMQDIVIIDIHEDFSQLEDFAEIDLVITTFRENEIPCELEKSRKLVFIKEFITNSDLNKVRLRIDEVYQEKYRSFLWEILPQWITEDFYLNLEQNLTREQIFNYLAQTFEKQGFVDGTFKKELEEREAYSSTAFHSKIAIPHSIKYDARQTGIIVMQASEPITWNDIHVQLILGLAVRKDDSKLFNRVFPRIIEVVAETYHVDYLARSEGRAMFLERMIDLLTRDGYYSL